MRIKNATIFTSKPAIEEMLKTNLPIKCAWQFALLSEELTKSLAALQSTRESLIRQYGTESGGQITVDQASPHWNEFAAAINELFDQEVEIAFDQIVLPQRVNGKELEVKPEILLALIDFVTVSE
jgi:hypothetical protein